MRRVPVALGLATCAVVASCSLDFISPGPGSPIAQLTVRLDLGFLQGDSLRVNANLDPGVGADGARAEVPDPHLTVLGARLPADSTTQDEKLILHWGSILATDPADSTPLVVEAPAVSGRDLPPPLSVALRRVAEGSQRRAWTPGEDVVLPLRPGVDESTLDDAIWNLAVSGWAQDGSEISLVTLVVHSPVGDTVRVPAGWLPGVGLDSLEARLRYTRYLSSKAPDGSYVVSMVVDQALSWVATARQP